MINLEKYGTLEYTDFVNAVRKSGYKLTDISRRLKKSANYVSTCGPEWVNTSKGRLYLIKPRFIAEASAMIGEEMFTYCIEKVLKENEELKKIKEQRYKQRGKG